MVDNAPPARMQGLGGLALAVMLVVALLVSLVLADESSQAETEVTESDNEYPWDGLWASTGESSLGFSLFVSSGVEPDEPWYFEINGALYIDCLPPESKTELRFTDCELDDPDLTAFEITLPMDPAGVARLTFTYGGEQRNRSVKLIPVRDEPESSPNVTKAWQHELSDECASNTGIWAEGGVVFAPCVGGFVELLDQRSGRLLGTATMDAAEGEADGSALEVAARGGVLYVATSRNGVVIFDVKEPSRPRQIGQFIVEDGRRSPQSVTNVHNLTLSPKGDLLFLMNTSHARSDLRIVDITDPTKPRDAGRWDPPSSRGYTHDIAIEEREGKLIAYLNLQGDKFQILDVTNPAAVKELGNIEWPQMSSHSGAPFRIGSRYYFAHTDEIYDGALTVLDVTDLNKPSVVSRFQTRTGVSIHNLRVVDGIAYIAYYLEGLRIVDLRDPAKPREVGHFDTVDDYDEWHLFNGAWGVHLDGGRIFISDRNTGIYAFEYKP